MSVEWTKVYEQSEVTREGECVSHGMRALKYVVSFLNRSLVRQRSLDRVGRRVGSLCVMLSSRQRHPLRLLP